MDEEKGAKQILSTAYSRYTYPNWHVCNNRVFKACVYRYPYVGPLLTLFDPHDPPEKLRYKYGGAHGVNSSRSPFLLMKVYLSAFFFYLLFFVPVVDLCNSLENDSQGASMSKKLHNFDLKGLQWSTFGRPRNSAHGEPASADAANFAFGAAGKDEKTAPSKLAGSLRNLSSSSSAPSEKADERRLQKGKQVVNAGPRFSTKQTKPKKPISEKASGSESREGAKRWNLRGRKFTVFSKGEGSSSPRGADRSSVRGVAERSSGNNRGKVQTQAPSLPTLSLSLTKEEAMEDLEKMLGKPPPKKLKKRPRNLQRSLDRLFPGAFLETITPDRYEVQGKPATGKGK